MNPKSNEEESDIEIETYKQRKHDERKDSKQAKSDKSDKSDEENNSQEYSSSIDEELGIEVPGAVEEGKRIEQNAQRPNYQIVEAFIFKQFSIVSNICPPFSVWNEINRCQVFFLFETRYRGNGDRVGVENHTREN